MDAAGLRGFLELHAKTKLAGEFSGCLEGKRHVLDVRRLQPSLMDEDYFDSAEEYQEHLKDYEESLARLAADPVIVVEVAYPTETPSTWNATHYAMAVSEAEQYGEHLVEVASLRLLDALDNLKALEPV